MAHTDCGLAVVSHKPPGANAAWHGYAATQSCFWVNHGALTMRLETATFSSGTSQCDLILELPHEFASAMNHR
ncbi:MAG: DUF1586 domain-containing protein [Oxalobacteraceae bacterium]|nr:DUF1586 domain-containing protein [Oxalobacteraceae bacterium]